MHQTPSLLERGMGLVLPPIEASQVQHLPIVKAYADKIGLVEAIKAVVPTELGVDPGTMVLGMLLDTFSGRSPLYPTFKGSECPCRFFALRALHTTRSRG